MADWRQEYLTSMKEAALKDPVNMELVQTCSQMADRISALEAEKAALKKDVPNLSSGKKSPATNDASDPGVAQLRLDLAECLRSKGVAESRLRKAEEESTKLHIKSKADARSIKDLTAERTVLMTRLKDKEHELREKRKLVESKQVQDEMIALNLQVSLAEKERDKVKSELKELIERWMKRMAQEADAMNLANEPLVDK